MKNILVISASAQKNGAGVSALNLFKEEFDDKEYYFDIVHLSDYNINSCIGCTVCFKKDKCFMNDDLDLIIDKMKKSHGFVFITPIYNMNISGLLKNFLDRTTYLLHKPLFYDKHSYIISTTDMAGGKIVNNYLKYIMNAYCIDNAGATSILAHKIKSDEDYRAIISKIFEVEASKFKDSIDKGSNYNPKLTQVIRFNLWKIKALKSEHIYPGDYSYWANKELVNADYFYPININPFKKILVRIISFRIARKIDKDM